MPVLSNLKVGRGISGIVQDQMPIFVYVESILPFSRNSYAAGALRAGRTLNSLLALWPRLPLFASRNPESNVERFCNRCFGGCGVAFRR